MTGKIPELWDPITGEHASANQWEIKNGRTTLPIFLDKNASLFIVLQNSTKLTSSNKGKNWTEPKTIQTIDGDWEVKFDTAYGGPETPVIFHSLTDWSKNPDSSIRFYSGTATYTKKINFIKQENKTVWLELGTVNNMAEVFVNGKSCGVAWTSPFRVDVSGAISNGENIIRIDVVNTWNNRLVGDSRLPEANRITSTVYPFKMEGKPLLPAGLIGPVTLKVWKVD
jgi:hypothetical protein